MNMEWGGLFMNDMPIGPVAPTREEYIQVAMKNLQATSRTARGVIDTSASAGKAAAIQSGLSQGETANLAELNFRGTVVHLYDQKDRSFTDPSQLREFIEGIATRINQGITKEGVSYRTDDSTKFPYTRVKDLDKAKDQFYQEFFERLSDTSADPIERGAWIEYRTNFTDHFFVDGCGKISKAIGYWTLMRINHKLPLYRGEKELYEYTPKKIRGEDPEYDKEHYAKWTAYYHSLFTQEESK